MTFSAKGNSVNVQDSLDNGIPVDNEPSWRGDKLVETWKMTYANSFPSFWRRAVIKTIETLTAKPYLLKRMRSWENNPNKHPEFWRSCLDEMGIEITTSREDRERIPAEGPLVVVANHPHGMIDGVVLARLLITRRSDFRILTRALLQGVEEADKNTLPVAFPHEKNSRRANLAMSKEAMRILNEDGCIALFPAGTVSTSESWFGPVVEPEWMNFVSKMVRQSNARVLPIYFTGSNSRAFQIANQIAPVFRQSLLMYEIRKAFDKPQSPIIGEVLEREALEPYLDDADRLVNFLRAETIKLAE